MSQNQVDVPAITVAEYNAALDHPTVRTIVRQFSKQGIPFRSDAFIEHLARLPSFPVIAVREIIAATRMAGATINGLHVEPGELLHVPTPFLTFLRKSPRLDAPTDLVRVEEVRRTRVLIADDRFGEETMPLQELLARWSGVVMVIPAPAPGQVADELEAYRPSVRVIPDLVTAEERRALIDYCEAAVFTRSRVMHRGADGVDDVLMARVRSSASLVLPDRDHPVLARLYAQCARMEGVRPSDIETIQCVRYKRSQKFRSHFDGGVELPRLTTYLLYLNDDFDGGETYFPMLDLSIAPKAGACLRFPSCDRAGRVLWPSEHGGLPVRRGVKYALNIWVRCPRPAVTAGPRPRMRVVMISREQAMPELKQAS